MLKSLKKLLSIALILLSLTAPSWAATLNIQVGFQQGNDGFGNLLGALNYVASPVFGSPSTLYTYVYGVSDNPSATPYAVFASDASARTYYDAIVGPSFVTAANGYTISGNYSTYAMQAGTIMQVNSNWNQTNALAPDFIIGKPTNISQFTNDSNFISSSTAASTYVPQTTTVAGHALSSNVTVSKSDVGLSSVPNIDATNANNISSGTLSASRLPTSGVTAASYTYSSLTVDGTGRITSASNGTAPVTQKAYTGTAGSTPTQLTNPISISLVGTISSGTVVYNLTADGTSGGTALFPNGPDFNSVNVSVNSSTVVSVGSWAWSNSNKTLTVTLNQASSTNALTTLLGAVASFLGAPTAAANGTTVYLTVRGS